MSDFDLTTTRLHLVPFNSDDAVLFRQLNHDAFIRKFMWDDEIIEDAVAEEIIVKNDQHFKEGHYGLWKIQQRGRKKVIGYVGLWNFFDEPQPQLIYALLEQYTQRGFATEASLAILEHAFNRLKFDYLIAATDAPHLASQKVAQRLGMTFVEERIEEGKLTKFYRIEANDYAVR